MGDRRLYPRGGTRRLARRDADQQHRELDRERGDLVVAKTGETQVQGGDDPGAAKVPGGPLVRMEC